MKPNLKLQVSFLFMKLVVHCSTKLKLGNSYNYRIIIINNYLINIKFTALQDRNEKDAQQYAAELKELQRTLDHDEKLKDFLFHKSNDR